MISTNKTILKLFLILIAGISCKKNTIEPLIIDTPKEISKHIYPSKIEIFDSINNCSATVYVEYTFDKKVKKIRREVVIPNAVLDSTFEINYTYEGQNLIKMTRGVEFIPSSIPKKHTELNYHYKEGRIYTAQRIITNETQDLDTTNYNYFVIKKSDGMDYIKYIKGIDSISISQNTPFVPQMDNREIQTSARLPACFNCGGSQVALDMHFKSSSQFKSFLIFEMNGEIYKDPNYQYYSFTLYSNDMLKIQNSIFENIDFIANTGYNTHRIHDLVYFQDFFISLPLSIDLTYGFTELDNRKVLDYKTKFELNSNSNGELTIAELRKNLSEVPTVLVERRSYKFHY